MHTDEFTDLDRPQELSEEQAVDQETLEEFAQEDVNPEVEASASDLGDPKRPELSLLPMELSFRLHRLTLNLAEVSALAPGSIIDAGIDLDAPIGIDVNGRQIGTGNLVKVGDRVGIQIMRWIRPDELGDI